MFRRVSTSESPLVKQQSLSSAPIVSPLTPRQITASSSPSPPRENLPPELPKLSGNRRPSSMFSSFRSRLITMKAYMNSTRLVVLLVLCLQNSMFTTLRRYSQGVLQETYSKVSQVKTIISTSAQRERTTNTPFVCKFSSFSTNSCYWQKSSKSCIRPG